MRIVVTCWLILCSLMVVYAGSISGTVPFHPEGKPLTGAWVVAESYQQYQHPSN